MRSNEKGVNLDKDIENALKKRAIGYETTEVTEEYTSSDEGEIRMIKRKIVSKNVPPDVSAVKLLFENTATDDLSSMTDEELENEKIRLLNILLKESKNDS